MTHASRRPCKEVKGVSHNGYIVDVPVHVLQPEASYLIAEFGI